MESLVSQDAVSPRVLLSPRHSFFGNITPKTRLYVVGGAIEALLHKCDKVSVDDPKQKDTKLIPERPVHNLVRACYCKSCDTLYIADDSAVPAWAHHLGRAK